jgi:simple sugar transport system permease protein
LKPPPNNPHTALRSHESALAAILVVLITFFTWQNPAFLTAGNAAELVNGNAFLALLALGVFVVLLSGGIDVSFTATAAAAQFGTALFLVHHGGNLFTTFLIAASIGLALGLINALLIHALRIPSIIVTLATLNLYQGLLVGLSGGRWIYTLPPWFQQIGHWKLHLPGLGNQAGLSFGALLLAAAAVTTAVLLRCTLPGRGLYALGGNETAARRIGFNPLHLRLLAYGFLGMLAGCAGTLNTLQVQVASPSAIVGRELDVFAAVVLGGANLNGGRGTLHGTLLGVALIAVLNNGLTLMRIPALWSRVLIGLVLILSVVAAAWRERSRHQPLHTSHPIP